MTAITATDRAPPVPASNPGPTKAMNTANAATYKLKKAPKSAPSITPIPTAAPAKIALSHGYRGLRAAKAATAKNEVPRNNAHASKPHADDEKADMFNAHATPPTTCTKGAKPRQRNNVIAENPRNAKAIGTPNFAYPTGPKRYSSP